MCHLSLTDLEIFQLSYQQLTLQGAAVADKEELDGPSCIKTIRTAEYLEAI